MYLLFAGQCFVTREQIVSLYEYRPFFARFAGKGKAFASL
jgi:hypothetical protein